MRRADLLDQLTHVILDLQPPHPTRVGVDGYDAAGKSTLANELAPLVEAAGRQCVRVEIDDFHPLGHKHRSNASEYTPESLYREAYDYASFVELVLAPAGPGGSRRVRLRLNNSYLDKPYPDEWVEIADDAVVIVDGVYLGRPELAELWDYRIWLDVEPDVALARKKVRNVAWTNSEEVVVDRHYNRNLPAHALYLRETNARGRADVVIENSNIEAPIVLAGS